MSALRRSIKYAPYILGLLFIIVSIFAVSPIRTLAQEPTPDAASTPAPTDNPSPAPSASPASSATVTPPASPTPTPCPDGLCPVTKDNYNASRHANFVFGSWADVFSCYGDSPSFSITGQGCGGFTVSKDNPGPPKFMVFNYLPSGGALAALTNSIAFMYANPPASGIEYLASSVRNFTLVKPAYAQVTGSGAAVIEPVQRLWQASRNIAYMGFIIIFLVIGVMTMMRKQLDQRTVVTVQQALPGVVIALILVTFSFFIAGLVIDLAFVGSRLVGTTILSALGTTGPDKPSDIVTKALDEQNIFTLFSSFITLPGQSGGMGTAANEISGMLQPAYTQFRPEFSLAGALAVGLPCLPAILGGFVAGVAPGVGIAALCFGGGAVAGAAAELVVPVLIYIVLLVALLASMFKLFFALISAFVSIILNTILGPLIIMTSALPGNGKAFEGWLKGLLANVLIFPAVFGLFIIVAALLGYPQSWQLNGAINPNSFRAALPLLGARNPGFIQFLLAYGMLLAVSGVPDYVKRVMKVEEPKEFIGAIGAGIQAGTGMAKEVVQTPFKVRDGWNKIRKESATKPKED